MDKSCYRKNYRSSYRKYNHEIKNEMPQKKSFSEIILKQCIICGVMMVFVLMINVIQTPFTNALKENIRETLSKNVSANYVKEKAKNISSFTNQKFNALKTLVSKNKNDNESSIEIEIGDEVMNQIKENQTLRENLKKKY